MEKDRDQTYQLREEKPRTEKGREYEESRRRRTRRTELQYQDQGEMEMEEEVRPEGPVSEGEEGTEHERTHEDVEQGGGDSPTRKHRDRREDGNETRGMFEMLLAEMKGMVRQGEENKKEMKEMKEEINKQGEENKKEMKEMNRKLDKQEEETRGMRQQIEKQGERQDELSEKIDKQWEKINEKIEKQGRELKRQMEQQGEQINERIDRQEHSMKETLKQQQEEMTKMEKRMEEKVQTVEEVVHQEIEIIREQCLMQEEKTGKICEGVENKICEIQKEIKEATENIGPTEIHVTCDGMGPLDIKSPKFNGQDRNPLEFLKRLEHYMTQMKKRKRQGSEYTLADIMEHCLEGSAAQWWQVIREEIITWGEFEEKFLAKYWNSDVQKGARRRLELEKYNGRITNKNRADYFYERVLILKNLRPPLEEKDIVQMMSEQYEETIQAAKRVQNITTIQAFGELLNREDLDDTNQQIRRRDEALRNQERPSGGFEPPRDFNRTTSYNRPMNNNNQRAAYNSNNNGPTNGFRRNQQYLRSPTYNNYQQYNRPNRDGFKNNYLINRNGTYPDTIRNRPTNPTCNLIQTDRHQANQPTTSVYVTPTAGQHLPKPIPQLSEREKRDQNYNQTIARNQSPGTGRRGGPSSPTRSQGTIQPTAPPIPCNQIWDQNCQPIAPTNTMIFSQSGRNKEN